MIKLRVNEPRVWLKIAPAEIVYTGDSKPYEGAYTVTPKIYEPVVLQTANRLLSQNVNVLKIPQYEVSNASGGLTLIMGDEYMQKE